MLKATAPYNFISLPEKILPAPLEIGRLSGEISLELEALTPLFIGGNGSKSFAPVDKPIIPGSSLRGMFKNIFKIVTCGAFRGRTDAQKKGEDFNDEHIYFRCLMKNNLVERNGYNWSVELNSLYNCRMVGKRRDKDGKMRPAKKARPGFLIRTEDNKFFIAPSIYTTDRKNDRLNMKSYLENFPSDRSCVVWDGKKAYIFTGKGGKKRFVRFTSLDYVDWSRENWITLPDDVKTSYEHDRNRRGVNLFKDNALKRAALEELTGKKLPDVKTLIPCHYLEEDGQVTAFGHGQCFRIPYKNRIGVAVKIEGNDAADFADMIFGNRERASRIYFEDATPKNFETMPQDTAHPLMQPNPTSYQLYLVQKGRSLNHWDSPAAQIRGYKMYWHKAAPDWQATTSELEEDAKRLEKGQEPLTKKMSPLKAGSKFTSKIRFKNLSAIELGALMMIFDLDGAKDAAYKIGQGKSFGFGSVKITPKLFIEDEAAYSELFDANGWKNPYRAENPAAYLDAFKNYLEEKNMSATWKNIMSELNAILNWSLTRRADWDSKVKSMSGNVSQKDGVDQRFKTREPLPTIFQVVGK